MNLSDRSLKNLEGVHPDLQLLWEQTPELEGYRCIVTEGLRGHERQMELVKTGASKTLNSRHLTGHATDFAMIKDGKLEKKINPAYKGQADLIKKTAKAHDIPITWGGDWGWDGTHIQLDWEAYPLSDRQKTPRTSKTIAASVVGFPVAAYIPEIFAEFKSMTNGLIDVDIDWLRWIQLGLILMIAGFVVWERVDKLRREGV